MRGERKVQFYALAQSLQVLADILGKACLKAQEQKLGNSDICEKEITELLTAAVVQVIRPRGKIDVDYRFEPAEGSLSSQLVDPNAPPLHRVAVYEIATVALEDIRTDILRILQRAGQGRPLPSDLADTIADLADRVRTPIDTAIFPDPKEKTEAKPKSRKRRASKTGA